MALGTVVGSTRKHVKPVSKSKLLLGVSIFGVQSSNLETIVASTAERRFAGVEWGDDLVPMGDIGAARNARELCLDYGLSVVAYACSWRGRSFADAINGAVALGASTVRIAADPFLCDPWRQRDLQAACDVAMVAGRTVSLVGKAEELAATTSLVRELAHPGLRLYLPFDPANASCPPAEARMAWMRVGHLLLPATTVKPDFGSAWQNLLASSPTRRRYVLVKAA